MAARANNSIWLQGPNMISDVFSFQNDFFSENTCVMKLFLGRNVPRWLSLQNKLNIKPYGKMLNDFSQKPEI